MKKLIAGTVAALLLGVPSVTHAATDPYVYVDNNLVNFTNQPVNLNGTTMVEFRTIFEQLGLTVGWDPASKTVIGEKDGLKIRLQIGKQTASVNGNEVSLAVAPYIANGHTLIPLRFIGESCGDDVHWFSNQEGQRIDIISSQDLDLAYAVVHNDIDLANKLLSEGANPKATAANQSIFGMVVVNGDAAFVKAFVKAGVDPNQVIQVVSGTQYTPLQLAIGIGNLETVQGLVESGAAVKSVDIEAAKEGVGHQTSFDSLRILTYLNSKITHTEKERDAVFNHMVSKYSSMTIDGKTIHFHFEKGSDILVSSNPNTAIVTGKISNDDYIDYLDLVIDHRDDVKNALQVLANDLAKTALANGFGYSIMDVTYQDTYDYYPTGYDSDETYINSDGTVDVTHTIFYIGNGIVDLS